MKSLTNRTRTLLLGIFLSGITAPAYSAESIPGGGYRIQPQERSEWIVNTWFSDDEQVVLTIGSEFLYSRQEVVALWNMSNGQRLWRSELDIPEEADHFSYEVKLAGFTEAKDPVLDVSLEIHDDKGERMIKSIVVLNHQDGKTRFRRELASGSEIRFDRDGKRVHEVSAGSVIKSYDVETGQVALTGFKAVFAVPFDGHWEQIKPGGQAVSLRLADQSREVRVEENRLLIDGRQLLTLGEEMCVFHSPVAGGRAYLHVSDTEFKSSDGQLIDLSDLSAAAIPGPKWPEGELTLSSSPGGRVIGRTAMHQNRTSDSPGDQFFGEVYASGAQFVREPWPNGILLHGNSLIKRIGDRFLILGSTRSDQSDVRVRQLYCLDLLELRLRWSVAHNHEWTDQVLYSNGSDILLANRKLGEDHFPQNLSGGGHRVVRDVLTGRRRAVEEGFDWSRMVKTDSYGDSEEDATDPKLAFWFEGKLTVTIGQNFPHPWIIYDEDGYFAASEDGGKLVGVVDGLDSYRIDQFAAQWNRPDIILERIGLASPEYIESVRDTLRQQGRISGTGKVDAGPRARILEAKLMDQTSLRLRFKGESGGVGLASFQIFVNGVPALNAGGKTITGADFEGTETIMLTPGANELELSFTDTNGREGIRQHRKIFCSARPPRDLYYLGIAVGDYDDPAVTDLKYTLNDATGVGEAVGGLQGYAEIHRRLLLNASVSQSGLKEAAVWLAGAKPQDEVIVFVAGHGVYHEGTYYYLPASLERERIAETGISFEQFERLLLACPARNKLFLIDTCESGEAPSKPDAATVAGDPPAESASELPRGMQGRVAWSQRSLKAPSQENKVVLPGQFYFADLRRRTGAVVFSSCEWDEVALEHSRWENGAFSEALIEALSTSSADQNGDGSIAKGELKSYVKQRVADLTGNRQHPTIDRDNPMQDVRVTLAGAIDGKDRGWLPVNLTTADKEKSRPGRVWVAQDSRFDGSRRWNDGLTIKSPDGIEHHFMRTKSGGFFNPGENSLLADEGVCWPDGILRYRSGSEPFFHHELWIDGRFSHVLPESRVPLAVVGIGGGYFATDRGDAWVWNNSPAESDLAKWTATPPENGRFSPPGKTDELGFAQGKGTLTWYKSIGDQHQFVVSYTGTMVNGKFEGETATLDRDGTTGIRVWKNGRKIR